MKNKSPLSKKEKLFCLYFVNSFDIEKSAKEAGYTKNPKKKGQALLLKSEVCDEITRLKTARGCAMKNSSELGFERMAFSSIADAVSLLYTDNPSREKLSDMDLFMVQEIRKPRDGALEIKFFDRFKALEKLAGMTGESEYKGSLLDAINQGAQNLLGEDS